MTGDRRIAAARLRHHGGMADPEHPRSAPAGPGDLAGSVALVTGGASGIGAAVVEELAAAGARVAVASRRVEPGTDLGGAASLSVRCDVGDAGSVRDAVERVVASYGRIDILVNSAGTTELAPAEDLSEEAWERVLRVNLTGTFLMCQAVGRHMLAAGRGTIVNIASLSAHVGLADHAAYAASKGGVVGLTKVLAGEWAGRAITVNTVSPTVVLTELGRKAWDGPQGDAMRARIPTGRFAEPAEVAAAVLFLTSAGARMITGADLLVDGGYLAR